MKMDIFKRLSVLIFSNTARDTYILFFGNLLSAFLGFIFTLFVARELSVSDFGVFSAAVNLVIILTSLTDLGISTGVINYVAENIAQGKLILSNKYIKASILIKLWVNIVISLIIILISVWVSKFLISTDDNLVAIYTAFISLSLALPMLIPSILQAQKRFVASLVADNTLYLVRLVFSMIFMYFFGLNVHNSLLSYVLGGLVGSTLGIFLLNPQFLFLKTEKKIYSNLLKFSGWIGINRIVSSISGRLDIQMLAILAGSSATGLYSIPSRLAGFIIVLTSSYSSVLATRLAGFANKTEEKKYIVKASFALIPILAFLVLWIIFAKPFMLLLFGDKYLEAVPVFQALTFSMMPFVLTSVSVAAIVYAMKKTFYIGAFSFFQIVAIFILNLLLIPKYGVIGPTITFFITNSILAIYTWAIVIKYYWYEKN